MLAARVIGEKQEGWAKSAPPPSTARVKGKNIKNLTLAGTGGGVDATPPPKVFRE